MIYKNLKSDVSYIDISNDNNSKHKPKVISLFTGAGGLDLGLEEAGLETVMCVENDINCRETLRFNRPGWQLFEEGLILKSGLMKVREPGDIREIEVDELLEATGYKKGEISLVVGGAPCQPFSNIGKREGRHDKKNGDLFLEFVRMIKGINPDGFIFENVVGITQGKHSEVIKYMIDQFGGLGYGISYSILNAANYGVPQRRERFFLIGLKNTKKPAFPFPTHFKDDKKFWENFVKDFDNVPKLKPKKWVTVRDAFRKISKNHHNREDYALMKISDLVVNRMTYIKQGENFKVLPMKLRPNCWKNGKHKGQDTFGRLVEDLPSVTIRTAAYNPAKGMYIHPIDNRGLSTLEMAALQSFPQEWVFKCYNRERVTLVGAGKQIGNAVPPLMAKALGLAIKKQLRT